MEFSPLASKVKLLFEQGIKNAFPKCGPFTPIVVPTDPKNGDYQCNNALPLFKKFGKTDVLDNSETVVEVCEQILKALPANNLFSEVTVAQRGFLYCRIKKEFVEDQLQQVFKNGLSVFREGPPRTVGIDFSSPNIAKEMHVGHLRSTILGESLSRLLEFLGHSVYRINHVGDWGTQFGIIIEEFLSRNLEGVPSTEGLLEIYRAGNAKMKEDESFKQRAKARVVSLQSGDPKTREIWEQICQVSRGHFQSIYKKLDIEITERGESFYQDLIPGALEDLQTKGLVTETDGALMCWTSASKDTPLIVRKSDGSFLYGSTDVAAVRYRIQEQKMDWLIYVTEVGQNLHMESFFAIARAAGWTAGSPEVKLDHVGFGSVTGEDGKKFKTRSGDTVTLEYLLTEAVTCATEELRGRGELTCNEAELMATGEVIGLAALKYYDLKQCRQSGYRFSLEKMLDKRGNTAVYLLYAFARIQAVFQKSEISRDSLSAEDLVLVEKAEMALGLKLTQFPDAITAAVDRLEMTPVCDFIWELTTAYSSFYQHCRIVGDAHEKSRLVLCQLTETILEKAFFLLGIKPVDRI